MQASMGGEYFIKESVDEEGNKVVEKGIRVTYSQNWKAYNKAQNEEIELFDELLKDLTENVEEEEQKTGRPRLSINEELFCSIQKVYSQLSSRRAHTLYRNAEEREQINKAPNYNMVNKFLNREDITPILNRLPWRNTERRKSISG
jgi:hypothetical protein